RPARSAVRRLLARDPPVGAAGVRALRLATADVRAGARPRRPLRRLSWRTAGLGLGAGGRRVRRRGPRRAARLQVPRQARVGATAAECARILKAAGAARVGVLTVARVL